MTSSPAETLGLRDCVSCRDLRHVSCLESLQEKQSHGQSWQEAIFAGSSLGSKI